MIYFLDSLGSAEGPVDQLGRLPVAERARAHADQHVTLHLHLGAPGQLFLCDFLHLCQTVHDFLHLCRTLRDFLHLCQTVRDFLNLCQATRDLLHVCQTARDFSHLCQTVGEGDPGALLAEIQVILC